MNAPDLLQAQTLFGQRAPASFDFSVLSLAIRRKFGSSQNALGDSPPATEYAKLIGEKEMCGIVSIGFKRIYLRTRRRRRFTAIGGYYVVQHVVGEEKYARAAAGPRQLPHESTCESGARPK
jgi:hypothetical protein